MRVSRTGTRRGQLQLSHSCLHMGPAGLEGVSTQSLTVCMEELGDPLRHAVEEMPTLLGGC